MEKGRPLKCISTDPPGYCLLCYQLFFFFVFFGLCFWCCFLHKRNIDWELIKMPRTNKPMPKKLFSRAKRKKMLSKTGHKSGSC